MGSQVFFDVRDAKIYYEMLANTEYCFNSNGGNTAINECMGLKTVSEVLDSYKTVYDDLIEKYIIPHYQGRIAVYGE